jgi:hypothetical protein
MRLAPQGDDRIAPRFAVELPLVYSSESLTFEAIVRDISRGGMFIASELLDPVGTPCDLTALPDGHPAMTFSGVVVHVAARAADGGRPAGLGVRFTFVSLEARRWLEILLARYPTDERDPYLS